MSAIDFASARCFLITDFIASIDSAHSTHHRRILSVACLSRSSEPTRSFSSAMIRSRLVFARIIASPLGSLSPFAVESLGTSVCFASTFANGLEVTDGFESAVTLGAAVATHPLAVALAQ